MAQTVKNLPAMQETRVRSLSQEDHLEKEMATHSSILLENSMNRGAYMAGYSPWSHKELDTTERLASFHKVIGNRVTADDVKKKKKNRLMPLPLHYYYQIIHQ